MKRLVASHGQHFLRDSRLIAELVGHSDIRKRDVVIDLGAGSGAITEVLVSRAAQIIAVENEPRAYSKLQSNMRSHDNVIIVQTDIMTYTSPETAYKIFANIPFSLSSKVVRKYCSGDYPPSSMYLIVQKQFAQKIVTQGDHFHAALGMMIAPWWEARIRRPLRKTDFTPPPAVETVLLELKPRELPLLPREQMQTYMKFVERCYAEPRYYMQHGGTVDKKPSTLSKEAWVALYSVSRH